MTTNTLRRACAWLAVLGLLLAVAPGVAFAHPLSPPVLTVREYGESLYHVSFRRSPLAAARLELDWPRSCRAGAISERRETDQLLAEYELVCTRPLAGQTLRVFGLVELELSLLVYLELERAEPIRVLLSPQRTSLIVPERESRWVVLRDYVALGVEHLLTGADHILFVLGLFLWVRGAGARLLALTAFTLGHSATLCLSALSVIRLPQGPVEIGIALSLLVVALEVLEQRRGDEQASRRPWLMASGFGLLHGLGFASALVETGLPSHAVPLALFGFNLGVELGQLLVVGALACGSLLLGKLSVVQHARSQWARVVVAYAIGGLAAMWCIERTLSLFARA
jgi:hydrogenase/urease accessory protein HupE